MMISVQNSPQINQLLTGVEQLSDSDFEAFANSFFHIRAVRRTKPLPSRETNLMLIINKGLGEKEQKRLFELDKVRISEKLTESEYNELTVISEQLEQLDADRLKAVAELAEIRNVPVLDLIKKLKLFKAKVNG
jgi:hypothetical protein